MFARERLGGRRMWVAVALVAAMCALPACDDGKKGYVETVLSAKDKAEAAACKAQLRSLGQILIQYAADHSARFPMSLDKLQLLAQQVRCPGTRGAKYVYIPGQPLTSPPTNVLVYEAEPVHGDKCNVLYRDGSVGDLTPAELAQAVARSGGGD